MEPTESTVGYEHEPEKNINVVNNEWFEAEHQGNVLMPSTLFAINTLVLDKLLNDPSPAVWRNFLRKQLSSSQVTTMGARLNKMHKEYGVPVWFVPKHELTAEDFSPDPAVRKYVSEFHLRHQVWHKMRLSIITLVMEYLQKQTGIPVGAHRFTYDYISNVGQQHPEQLDQLRQIIAAFKTALQSHDIKDELTTYRAKIRKPTPEFIDHMHELICPMIQKRLPDVSPAVIDDVFDALWRQAAV